MPSRKFYNYTADVYTLSNETVRGSLVHKKTIKHSGIKVAFWGNTGNYRETSLATNTDGNSYEINLHPQHDIAIGDYVFVDGRDFMVTQVVQHHNHKGKLDNWQAFITIITKGQ